MALEETVDSLEGISEEHQDLYVQQEDGKFKIDVSGLKSALQKERKAKAALEKKLVKPVEDPGVDDLKKQLDMANSTIKEMKVGSHIKAAALEAGVDPAFVDDVLVLTKGSFTLGEDGKVLHLDADGEPSGIDAGKFFQGTFKQTKPIFYVNTGRKGSGAQPSAGGVPTTEGRIQKAIESKDTRSFINETMSKVKKI